MIQYIGLLLLVLALLAIYSTIQLANLRRIFKSVKVKFRLRAKYPIRVRTFQSRVYEYYDPAVASAARPVLLEVHR